jgi:hypothetical protein
MEQFITWYCSDQYQQTTLSNGDTIWHGFIVTGVK